MTPAILEESAGPVPTGLTSPAPTIHVEGHKLHHHPDRVAAFRAGERIFPLYVEFSPVGRCNHRCTFCAYDYIGYPDRRLPTERTEAILREMGSLGVKSALWAGEGEPLLHPDLGRIVATAHASGIDNGIYTNATALTEKRAREILPHLAFLRVSFNAGDAATYAEVHRVPAKQFDIARRNIARAVELEDAEGWGVTIGMQIVVLPENLHTVEPLARIARDLGVDYLSVKPFVQHPSQERQDFAESFRPEDIEAVALAAEAHSREGFRVLVRRASFANYHERSYRHCLGLPFFAFILSDGNAYTCGPYYGSPDHVYGNVLEQSFEEIWTSDRTAAIQRHAACRLDTGQCMPNCRPDAVNRYLWELAHPPAHVNFI
ncbi:MAG: radical SAM protein [Planctomycetes bacterium]|nr:radical SAM protein [Planctomycetota bacterium]